MRLLRFISMIVLIIVSFCACSKTDISGKWIGKIEINNETFFDDIDVMVIQRDKEISGNMTIKDTPNGQLNIKGVLNGDNLSFNTEFKEGAYFAFDGKVFRENIKGVVKTTFLAEDGGTENSIGTLELIREPKDIKKIVENQKTNIRYNITQKISAAIGVCESIRGAFAGSAATSEGNIFPGKIADWKTLRAIANDNGATLKETENEQGVKLLSYTTSADRTDYTLYIEVIGVPDEKVGKVIEIKPSGIEKLSGTDVPRPVKAEQGGEITEDYLKNGNERYDKGDYQWAIEDFNKAIELNPKNSEAYRGRGLAKGKLKNYWGALEDCNKAIELNPKDSVAYLYRGVAKSYLNDYRDAIEDYSKAIELNPKDSEAYLNRGIAKSNLGNKDGACLDYRKAGELGYEGANEMIQKNCQ